VAGFGAACVGLAPVTDFSTVGFRVDFGLAGAAGVIVARVVCFSTERTVLVRLFAVGLAGRAAFSATLPVAFVLPKAAGFARRSALAILLGLAA